MVEPRLVLRPYKLPCDLSIQQIQRYPRVAPGIRTPGLHPVDRKTIAGFLELQKRVSSGSDVHEPRAAWESGKMKAQQ